MGVWPRAPAQGWRSRSAWLFTPSRLTRLCWHPRLSDCNKENTLHGCSTQKGSLKAGEQRGGSEVIGRGSPRKADGQRPSLDYVELSPLTQGSPQRVRGPARTLDRPAKQEELERDLAQRSEERRRWFEATDSRPPETAAGEGPRRGLGAPLTEDQQNRLSEEIEKKWQELEKLPLRENKRVPLTALLNQSRGERRGPPGDSHEALEKEVGITAGLREPPPPASAPPVPAVTLRHSSGIPTVTGSSPLIHCLVPQTLRNWNLLSWTLVFLVLGHFFSFPVLSSATTEKGGGGRDHLLSIFRVPHPGLVSL